MFDTNVYVSAFVVPMSKSDLALRRALRGAFELVVSPEILAETLGKLADKFDFPRAELVRVEENVRAAATVVEPDFSLSVLADEPDNRILECAVYSGALAVVTGDKDLLALGSYEGVGIMTVAELLYTFPESPCPV